MKKFVWMSAAALLFAGHAALASSVAAPFVAFGTKWGDPTLGTGASVTYSFMPTGTNCVSDGGTGCEIISFADLMPSGWEAEVMRAFRTWSDVANISFAQVPDDGAPMNFNTTSGDIRIGAHLYGTDFTGPRGTIAVGYFPPPNGNSIAGDILFDAHENWQIGTASGGFDILRTMVHELGHAIGLRHSTVDGSIMDPQYRNWGAGLHPDDIAGAQFLYGPAVVPLPAGLPLVAAGVLGLGLLRRLRSA